MPPKKDDDEEQNEDVVEKIKNSSALSARKDDDMKSISSFKEDIPVQKIRRKFKHVPFTDKDFKMRDPIEEYRIIKEIEDEVLNFKKENVKTYVISAGILYGKGEAIFNSHI